MACWSHQGVTDPTVDDRCMRRCDYIVVDCSLIGSGENMKLTDKTGKLVHDVKFLYGTRTYKMEGRSGFGPLSDP